MAFDSNSAFDQISTSGDNAANQAASAAGGTARAIGQQPVYIVSDAIQTVSNLPNLPLANNLSVNGAIQVFTAPPTSVLNGVLDSVTGVSIGQNFGPTSSNLIAERISGALSVLTQQVIAEIKNCIDQRILALTRKNPIADLFFFYNFYKSQLLAQITTTIDRAVFKAVNDLFYKKLKIQQVALYRQKLLEEVRKLCPNASPTAVRNYGKNSTASLTAATSGATNVTNSIQSIATTSSNTTTPSWKNLV